MTWEATRSEDRRKNVFEEADVRNAVGLGHFQLHPRTGRGLNQEAVFEERLKGEEEG